MIGATAASCTSQVSFGIVKIVITPQFSFIDLAQTLIPVSGNSAISSLGGHARPGALIVACFHLTMPGIQQLVQLSSTPLPWSKQNSFYVFEFLRHHTVADALTKQVENDEESSFSRTVLPNNTNNTMHIEVQIYVTGTRKFKADDSLTVHYLLHHVGHFLVVHKSGMRISIEPPVTSYFLEDLTTSKDKLYKECYNAIPDIFEHMDATTRTEVLDQTWELINSIKYQTIQLMHDRGIFPESFENVQSASQEIIVVPNHDFGMTIPTAYAIMYFIVFTQPHSLTIYNIKEDKLIAKLYNYELDDEQLDEYYSQFNPMSNTAADTSADLIPDDGVTDSPFEKGEYYGTVEPDDL